MVPDGNKNIAARRAVEKPATLLCIDDEAENLKLLSEIFDGNYRLIATKSGEQGYELALKHKPDLILLDVVMPQYSGFELIKRIKATSELRNIPIIFITGLANPEDEEAGLTLGACDYIQKPFNNSIVKVRVNTHLEIVRQRKLLERYAHIDALTEVPNRRKWDDDALLAWQKAEINRSAMVVGIIDIDHFKKFNDCYGHPEGDKVLRTVAQTLKRKLYDHSGHIFRCGGEEFYFYFPANKETKVKEILSDCLNSISELKIKHQQAPSSPYLSISIGAIKITPNKKVSLSMVIKSADDLLYQVKNKTRNAVQYQEIAS